jgi:predicted GNAT family acetyltransferase
MIDLHEIFLIEGTQVQFRSECVGAHSGQSDMRIDAIVDGMYAGHLSYSIYNGEISIQYVQVKQEYKKQGIAKQMFEYLMETEGVAWDDINHGTQTDEGSEMYDALHKRFHDPNFEGKPLKMSLSWSEIREIAWELVEQVENEKGIEIEYDEDWSDELVDIIKSIRYQGGGDHESIIQFLLTKPEIQGKVKEKI